MSQVNTFSILFFNIISFLKTQYYFVISSPSFKDRLNTQGQNDKNSYYVILIFQRANCKLISLIVQLMLLNLIN